VTAGAWSASWSTPSSDGLRVATDGVEAPRRLGERLVLVPVLAFGAVKDAVPRLLAEVAVSLVEGCRLVDAGAGGQLGHAGG
jgi:hypothetical protein